MKMNWYHRLLLSYTPIFFVVISSIIFAFFMLLNNASEKRFMETNRAMLEEMVFHIDANLKLIERNVSSQLLTDPDIRHFFAPGTKSAFDYFRIQKRLAELNASLPFTSTVYLYNVHEQRILSESGAFVVHTFGDREFLFTQYNRSAPTGWTNPRPFAYLSYDENPQKVVSLVKHYNEGGKKQGAIVVNVFASSILSDLNRFNENRVSNIQIVDTNKHEFAEEEQQETAPAIVVTSPYTGWQYYSNHMYEREYSALMLFSNAWVIFGIVVIVLALIGFTLVSHMHFKPIQSIMEKVRGFSAKKSEDLRMRGTADEFAFIEKALDHLIKKSVDYDNLYKEDSMLRQQRLFHELLAGHESLTDREWAERMQSHGLPYHFERLAVLAVEIDHYPAFVSKFKPRDQHLLKFVLEKAFYEVCELYGLFVWHAWMKPEQIAFVIHFDADSRRKISAEQLADEFRTWIRDNLEMTVTIGIGAESDSIESIADSYQNANENVSLKTVFGTDTLIDNRKRADKTKVDHYVYLQALESVAQSFRMSESDWREKLAQIFNELKGMQFTKQDMNAFINSFAMQMEKAVAALSPEIGRLWQEEFRWQFDRWREETETLDELYERLMEWMYAFEAKVDEDRQARKHHSIAQQAKSYIDAHYADPGLSLARVSDILRMQPSALSQLFKQELGERFIDYVLKVRLEHAKRLLTETNEPIPSIAEQVGYQNVISFYRAFKKVEGIPPGEYRSQYRHQKGK